MPAITARLFGAPSLTDSDGRQVGSLLAQSKRFAVLAYLLVEARGTPVMRDKVAALFWPDLDQSGARQALRQSLHVIRKELGDDVVTGVGAEMIAANPTVVTSDVAAFEAAIASGADVDGLAGYGGHFLDGFYVSGAPEVEHWAADVRHRLREKAVATARALADRAESAGDLDAAARWLHQQMALADIDERPLRRLMGLLRRQGNAAAAIAAYDAYAARMHRELELEPSGETRQLLAQIRADVAGSQPPMPRVATPYRPDSSLAETRGGGAAPAPSPRILPRLAFAATIVIAVIGAVLVANRSGSTEPGIDAPSIAVLPFLDLSQARDQQFLSDGVTEELITALSRVRGLRVTARTSSFAYRDAREDVPRIARDLGVTSILEGSIRRDGERIRVTAQLIDAKSGFHIWSANFDRQLSDLFGLQDEIAQAIANAMRTELIGPSAVAATDVRPGRGAAYDAYLRGRFYWNQRGFAGVGKAIAFFEEAVKADPTYAPAQAGLASALQFAPTFGLMTPAVAFPRAATAVRRALALDSTLAEARAVNGYIKMTWERDFAGAERELRRAIELAPGYATAHQWMRLYFVSMGRYPEAVDEALRARELDPVSPSILAAVGDAYTYARRYDLARAAYERALQIDTGFVRALSGLGNVSLLQGDSVAALRWAMRSVARDAEYARAVGHLAFVYGRTGQLRKADSVLGALRATARARFVPAYAFALAHAGHSNRDSTVHWLGRVVDDHDNWAGLIAAAPEFAFVASDPRMASVVGRMRGTGRPAR